MDRGDSLIEILVSLTVLSIGITAIVFALGTNASTTITNRGQAQAETSLLAASEYVKALAPTAAELSACPSVLYPILPTAVATISTIPHDPAYSITYGPASPLPVPSPAPSPSAASGCSSLVAVPVRVFDPLGNGFDLKTLVVKRR
jgi:prepilin-type N-terminal cleavage/methylation domain-containing protein